MEDAFERGLALFNGGEYYEAHEVWEEAWMHAPPRERFFLQALIHLAVGLHHARMGNEEGARRQRSKALGKLAGYLPSHGGLDTRRLYGDAQRGWAEPLRMERATIGGKP